MPRSDVLDDSSAEVPAASAATFDSKAQGLVLHFEGDGDPGAAGLTVEPWVLEQFEYFGNLLGGGFSESRHGEARLPCRRSVFETFLLLACQQWRPAAVDLTMRMEVLRFADMVSASELVLQLAESIRADYLVEGEGARDSAVAVLCELADLLTPSTDDAHPHPSGSASRINSTTAAPGAQLAPLAPTPAAQWLVAAATVTPVPILPPVSQPTPQPALPSEPSNPFVELREACLEALPSWSRQRFAKKPQLWRLELKGVLDVYSAEASPRAESSWLALHAARRLSRDILPFASVESEVARQLAKSHPEMVIRRCVSLCIRELPYSKTVSGFGGTEYQIQVALSPGHCGGWVLGVGGQGLCALRKVVLEIEGDPEGVQHELQFTGLMEHASGRQEDAVLGFASGTQVTPLPFSAKLTILEYPLHLAVQTYIGLNFNTMAMLCQGFDFGPMDLACVMDLWLQSDQLRRVPEADISEVVRRTLRFVKLCWAPVVRVSFVVCMHSCWMQAGHLWWHASLIRSCVELEVWRGPADGEPGAGTFRSYIAQIVQHALAPYPEVFLSALQRFFEKLPPITRAALDAFFPDAPSSISDPVAIVARHYLDMLRHRASAPEEDGGVSVSDLVELLEGFRLLVGQPMERSDPRTAVLAFLSLAALCDLRHQRRLCAESFGALLALEGRSPDGPETRFWAGCFFTLLDFSRTLAAARTQMDQTSGARGVRVSGNSCGAGSDAVPPCI